MSYETFANQEFDALGWDFEEDGPNKWIRENCLELLRVFATQGHSGFSAPYCIELFHKLALLEPLSPLTGISSEWNEVGPGVLQNKRCSHVFMENGQAYDSTGRIFREPNGACFTSINSRVPITFPYTPTREYVDVPEEP